MRVLHVAALPFPTHQGTQALLRTMLESEAQAGRDSHLLTYAAAGYAYTPPFVHHQVADFPQVRSLRSGPSVGKVVLDLQLVRSLRSLSSRLRPQAIVAHHVEAAAAVVFAGGAPWCFVAHTDLGAELPYYGHPRLSAPLARVGRTLDRWLLRRAPYTAAVSPMLTQRLRALCPERSSKITYLPPVMSAAQVTLERALARQQLGISTRERVLLYAGNLDPYQGWQQLLQILARVRSQEKTATLLVATASSAQPLHEQACRLGLRRALRVVDVAGELQRARIHAAADVSLVVRKAQGGVPIKLLDAMARGTPTVLGPTAAAGLNVADACALTADGSVEALAAEVLSLLWQPDRASALARAARRYVAHEHSATTYLRVLDNLLSAVI